MKSEKGITLVVLVITIILLIILSGVTISQVNIISNSGYLNRMKADIIGLEEKVQVYYNKYQSLPKTGRSIEIEEVLYYEIDLSRLNDITLNNGRDYGKVEELQGNEDVYLVNNSLDVYYLKGIKNEGQTYHTYHEYD